VLHGAESRLMATRPAERIHTPLSGATIAFFELVIATVRRQKADGRLPAAPPQRRSRRGRTT
jgi:hypothetical protein